MNSENITYYRAPGKLLLTGEYLVLHGSLALSLPVKFGQSLQIKSPGGSPALIWKTLVNKKLWFEAVFSLPDFVIGNTSDFQTAQALRALLLNARSFNPGFLARAEHLEAVAELDYDISWGLGSSSSLTVNVARWANIDPFDLHFKTYNGSGYDVASAYLAKPLIYSLKNGKPEYFEINFKPSFSNQIWFAYLGKKKSSPDEIVSFEKNRKKNIDNEIDQISLLTKNVTEAKTLSDFQEYLRKHDQIISGMNGSMPLSKKVFHDFQGYAKYLGAWGGDFAMISSAYPPEYILSYLRKKDFKIWFSYNDIIDN